MAPPSQSRNADLLRARALDDLRLLVTTLTHSARAVEGTTGMTNAQLLLLRQIALRDGQTIGQLAERVMTRQSATSLLVARLESTGHVRRMPSPDDRRARIVALTATGRRIIRKAPRTPGERVIAALRRLTPADVRALRRGLGALLTTMRVRRDVAPMMMFESRPRAG